MKTEKEIFEDAIKEHGSIRAAARALGTNDYRIRSRLKGVPPRAEAAPKPVRPPMSESQHKFRAEWTADDCIAELRRIAQIDETKVITRNYFRVNSDISESTWNRYFGTFLEFKRQANITLSRHVHGVERAIARHASKDNQRRANTEKSGWEDAYLRPVDGRWQTCLVASDIHDTSCDPFYRRLLIDTAKRVQPEKIVLNGDIYDLPEFSKWSVDPRNFDVVGRIRWVNAFVADLRAAAPDAEITMVEGNHEYRLVRHMTEATPALMVVLSDLHGMTVPGLLGLQANEVNYIARMDLAAFNEADIRNELKKNYVVMWDALLFHHFPEGRNMGYPGANGHHHKHIMWNQYSPQFGPYEWHQLGTGHIRSASYCAGERWSNGFMLCHVDTHKKRTQFEYIDTTFEQCMIGGRFYQRQADELLVV